MMVVGQLGHRCESIIYILVSQCTCLEVRLGVIRVNPVGLDGVGIDARADVQFVTNDDKGDVWVIRRRLKGFLPPYQSVIRVTP